MFGTPVQFSGWGDDQWLSDLTAAVKGSKKVFPKGDCTETAWHFAWLKFSDIEPIVIEKWSRF